MPGAAEFAAGALWHLELSHLGILKGLGGLYSCTHYLRVFAHIFFCCASWQSTCSSGIWGRPSQEIPIFVTRVLDAISVRFWGLVVCGWFSWTWPCLNSDPKLPKHLGLEEV